MKTWVLAVAFLIVGLIVGLGIGGASFAVTATVTKYETVTSTSPVTSILTTTIEKTATIEKTVTSTSTTTLTSITTVTQTERTTATVTMWPKFSPEGKIGEEVGERGLIFVIHGVEERWKLGIFEPQPGNRFIVIDIEIKNVLPDEKTVSPGFMYVVDEQGKRYAYSLASVGITGYFPGSANLKSGESVRGYAAFEIPETSTPKYFIYEVFGERQVSIALREVKVVTAATTTITATPQTQQCHPSYPDVCIPPPPPNLDCKDIPYRNFKALPPDPHNFDTDGDGIGCET